VQTSIFPVLSQRVWGRACARSKASCGVMVRGDLSAAARSRKVKSFRPKLAARPQRTCKKQMKLSKPRKKGRKQKYVRKRPPPTTSTERWRQKRERDRLKNGRIKISNTLSLERYLQRQREAAEAQVPECPICLENLDDASPALACGHQFHAACMQEVAAAAWAGGSAKRTRCGTLVPCPLCRAQSCIS